MLAVWLVCCSSPDATQDPATMQDAATSHDAATPLNDAQPQRLIAYVSGYAPTIQRYDVASDGALTALGTTTAAAADPSFLAISATALYAVSESASRIGAYAIDPASGALTPINDAAAGGSGPAYLGLDRSGAYALVANYGDGSVATLAIRSDGGVSAPTTLAVGQNAHMIITDPSNRYAFVPCLGSDYVAQLLFNPATGQLTPNAVPHLATAAGAGPRHLAFAPDGQHVYLINELNSTLSALALDATTGRLSVLQTVSTRAATATGTNTGAEIHVHPSGHFVYASNRGDNTIATFARGSDSRLTLVGHVATTGQTPRDFSLDPTGARLYVANQDSNTVMTFAIDLQTGLPSPLGTAVTATAPTFIGFATLVR